MLVVVVSVMQPSANEERCWQKEWRSKKKYNNILPRSKAIKTKTQFLNLKNKVRREFIRRICVHGDGGPATICLQLQFLTWKPRHRNAIVLVRVTHTLQHLVLRLPQPSLPRPKVPLSRRWCMDFLCKINGYLTYLNWV